MIIDIKVRKLTGCKVSFAIRRLGIPGKGSDVFGLRLRLRVLTAARNYLMPSEVILRRQKRYRGEQVWREGPGLTAV